MACRDTSNALQLNIKVNSENLLPNSQKYNVGSLRVPADPSWPKIPQRRLADDYEDVIQPPCVVTLTGTPRRSRSIVRSTNSHQSSRSNFSKDQVPISLHQGTHQKMSPLGHTIKRRPGCADPRFKKVTTVKSQVTPTDPPDREHQNPGESRSALLISNQSQYVTENVRNAVPEKDTDQPKVTQQEAEKPGEIRGMDSIGVQTTPSEDPTIEKQKPNSDFCSSKQTFEKIQEPAPEIINEKQDICSKENTAEEEKKGLESEGSFAPKNEKSEEQEKSVVCGQQENSCLQCCQGKSMSQFFFVVDNKGQASSLGAVQIDAGSIPPCQFTAQCYNVQVPVLSYQNLPLQISTQQMLGISSTSSIDHNNPHPQELSKSSAQLEEKGNVPAKDCPDVKKISENEKYLSESRKLATPPVKLERKYETGKKYENRIQQLLSDTTDSEIYSLEMKKLKVPPCFKETSGSGSDYDANTESQFHDDISQVRKKKRHPFYCVESSIENREVSKLHEDSKTSRAHRKMKSEQNLSRSIPFGNKNYKNVSDPHISSREAYRVKDGYVPRCKKNENDPTTDDSDNPNLPDCCETHRTDLSNIEEGKIPTGLPVKTQQLLNKSYMEYYDKLRSGNLVESSRCVCQIAVGGPKKRKAETDSEVTKIVEEKEGQAILTMEKLSALSNIINCNLNPGLRNSSDVMQTKQLYVNENMKSSSDPTAGTQSAVPGRTILPNCADVCDSSAPSSTLVNKIKRKREKPVERRILKLKTIAFFGFMMYAMIVLLPMMYTYFLYDEYEDYEDVSYVEYMLEYIVSSFREAFGGLFDTMNEIFFQPVSSH